ncbi:MAG: TIGR04255 family protein [Betaproteobacteria bacterium]
MAKSPASPSKRIKFENPPINELVIALYHLPIVELKAQHIGIYWLRIRDQFEFCEQQFPVISVPNLPETVPNEVFPLPRFWFFSTHHPLLIQLQRNAFMFNWRRVANAEYPHYETVATEFWKALETYKVFLQESLGAKLDVIQRCELTYVNIIDASEAFKNVDELPNVLPLAASLTAASTKNRTLAGLNATVTYRVSPTLLLDLAIRSGTRAEPKEAAAVLELKAYGAPADLSLESARSWYDAAHDATYSLFLDATGKDMQRTIWKHR